MEKELGIYYFELAKEFEKKEDEKNAFENYKKSAEYNHPLGTVMTGQYYEEGRGVEYDDDIAIEYYIKGIELEEPLAFESMGLMYQLGRGVEQSNLEAYKLYKKAKTSLANLNMMLLEVNFYDEVSTEIEDENVLYS